MATAAKKIAITNIGQEDITSKLEINVKLSG